MNLETVNTVNELVEQNNTPVEPTKSRLDCLVDDLDLEETYELTLRLIQRLGSFHQSVISDLSEQSPVDTDRLIVWCSDEQKLHTCHDLLREVSDND